MRWWRSLSVDQRERRLAVTLLVAGLLEAGVGCADLRPSPGRALLEVIVGVVFLACAAVIYSRHRSTRR